MEEIVLYRWMITDERTGKRRMTRWAMTEEEAKQRYPDAEKVESTREVRTVGDLQGWRGVGRDGAKQDKR